MTTVNEVAQAIAEAVELATGLPCVPHETRTIQTPVGQVVRDEFDPRMVLGETSSVYTFLLRIYENALEPAATTATLNDRCEVTGALSVLAAVQDDTNWPDDLVDYAQVVSIGRIEWVELSAETIAARVEIVIEVCW